MAQTRTNTARETYSVVDSLFRLLSDVVARQRLHHGLEAGLMEVRESKAVRGVQTDLVRR